MGAWLCEIFEGIPNHPLSARRRRTWHDDRRLVVLGKTNKRPPKLDRFCSVNLSADTMIGTMTMQGRLWVHDGQRPNADGRVVLLTTRCRDVRGRANGNDTQPDLLLR